MDILLGIGIALLGLFGVALALCLIGAIGYLVYIPVRSGWALMRLLLENFGFFERDSPTESIEKTVEKIHEEIAAMNKKLDQLR